MAESTPFKLGKWLVQPTLNTLVQGERTVRIEPRYMDLLVYLAKHQNKVVSPDEIHEQVWTGMVVGDHSVYQAIARLRKSLGDSANKPRYIETVPKRGYRLLAAVAPLSEDEEVNLAAEPQQLSPQPVSEKNFGILGRKQQILGGLAFIAAIVLLLSWLPIPWPSGETDSGRRLAVLPFESHSSGSQDNYLAFGLSSELLNKLGSVEGLEVIGPRSSARFKPGDSDLGEIGRRLGAELLLVGGVERQPGRVKIDLALLDALNGRQIWSDNVEESTANLFELQKQILERVTAALGLPYPAHGAEEPEHPTPATLEAYGFYLLGRFHKMEWTQKSLEKAFEMYNRAVEIDAGLSAGYRGRASVRLLLSYFGDISVSEAVQSAMPDLERALELNRNDEETYGTLALARYLLGDFAIVEELCEKSLSINRNYAFAWLWRGLAVAEQGRLNQALEYTERAALLEPLSGRVISVHAILLNASGRGEEAVKRLEAIDQGSSSSVYRDRTLSEILLTQGRLADAYRYARRALDSDPSDDNSKAQLALALQEMGQREPAMELFTQAKLHMPGIRRRLTLVLIYLQMNSAEREIAERQIAPIFELDHKTSVYLWRQINAFEGMSRAFAGDYERASELLRSAIGEGQGQITIFFKDFDLLLCTTHALSLERSGDAEGSKYVLQNCERSLDAAHQQGWDSFWKRHTKIQIEVLQGHYEQGLKILENQFETNQLAVGLLKNDPILEPLRENPRYLALVEALEQQADKAWAEIVAEREK